MLRIKALICPHHCHQILRLAEIDDIQNRQIAALIESDKRGAEMRKDALMRQMERRLDQDKKRLAVISGTMWGLSPLKKLSQGYGFVTDESGERLASVKQAPVGSRIHVQVMDGKLTAAVESQKMETRMGEQVRPDLD